MKIAFFGSSLVSAYWNGAATYYRGILSALYDRGHRTIFYEPDAWDRQRYRDIADPPYARSRVYQASAGEVVRTVRAAAEKADLLVKASGVGVFDSLLEQAVLEHRKRDCIVAFWDVDAAATLARIANDPGDPFRSLIPEYDLILTYGGGEPVTRAYRALGAKRCFPIYNALDPSTHHPVPPDPTFRATLSFLGNRLPDREERVVEFFFTAARSRPDATFLLGGSGWDDLAGAYPNVQVLGHVYTEHHNAFNCSPLAVLNICRESMARCGFSPPTRLFEAAGAAACVITDAWEGIETFLEPDRECLVAHTGAGVTEHMRELTSARSREIGRAALARILAEHTYGHRAALLEQIFREL
ncbi:MAG TPA: glycosyltransferase [Candidatus Eisenbacteria bacterium]|nr:glycosyltransferase [Candidatus Eisenbacteria bacterium]